MSDLRALARRLGGEVAGRNSITIPGPGHSAADNSLQITFDPDWRDGFRVYPHSARDNWQDCRDYVRDLLGGTSLPGSSATDEAEARRKREWAMQAWHEARDPRGTVVERYLRSRGISLPETVAGRVIRSHPALRRRGLPACHGMVALMRNVETGEPQAIHRTFLTSEGRKVDGDAKRMLGPAAGAAIMLDRPEGEELVVGEGIETALSARPLGITAPAWALGSCRAIAALPVLPGIRRLLILGETGDGGANLAAARECADRWRAEGRQVEYLRPEGGKDANDILVREGPANADA
jgi:hypothetical protein